jgi:hypothetical protein
MIDRAALVGRKGLIGVQLGGERRSDIRGSEGVVGSEQNSSFPRESHKTRQGRGTRRQCRVEIEALKTLEYVGLTRCVRPEDVREFSEALRGIRHEATRMRQDDVRSRVSVHDAVQYELNGGSGGVERIIDEGTGKTRRSPYGWLSWMHICHSMAAIEFCPDWLEGSFAEISSSIVGEQNHAIGPQRVERMFQFVKRAVDIRERQCREVTEAIRPFRNETRRLFVDAPRHLPSPAVIPADDARRGQREYPGCDLLGVHEVNRAVG